MSEKSPDYGEALGEAYQDTAPWLEAYLHIQANRMANDIRAIRGELESIKKELEEIRRKQNDKPYWPRYAQPWYPYPWYHPWYVYCGSGSSGNMTTTLGATGSTGSAPIYPEER